MQKQAVIFDHDGGVDDLLSLMLLLTMEHIELLGVTVTPADCFLSDATVSTLKILKMFNRSDVPVAQGTLQGQNPFPYEWRAQPKICNALPDMLNIEEDESLVVTEPAHEFIANQLVKAEHPVTVLMTGPCTNLAAALENRDELKAKVKELVWMGGAVDVAGNVAMHNHNSSAEWNVYWDAPSAASLFAMGLNIKLVALDATNYLPVDMDFLKQLAKQSQFPMSNLAGQFWATTINSIPSYEYTYHLWDVLATAYLGLGACALSFESRELKVSVAEPNTGQTYEEEGCGQWVELAVSAQRQEVLDYLFEQFKR